MEEEISDRTISDIPLDSFMELSESLQKEMCGEVPEPWIQIAKDMDWTEETIKETKAQLLKIFIEATYCPDDRRQTYLEQYFDADKCNFLTEFILTRKLKIAKALMKEHNATVKPVLDDFNWKVKWILGNSSSTVMKYPLVELDLKIRSHTKENLSNILLELNQTELDTLINVLEDEYNSL